MGQGNVWEAQENVRHCKDVPDLAKPQHDETLVDIFATR